MTQKFSTKLNKSRITRLCIGIATSLIALGIAAPLVLYLMLHYFILPSERLTAQVVQEVNELTNMHFDCQRIEVTYWDTWPSIGISVQQGTASMEGSAIDSTSTDGEAVRISFSELTGSIQLLKLLKERQLHIADMQLIQPDIHVETSRRMPELLKNKAKKKKQKKHKVELDINRFEIKQGYICVSDSRSGMQMKGQQSHLLLKGELTDKEPSIDIDLNIDSLTWQAKQEFAKQHMAFQLRGHCDAANQWKEVSVQDMRFFINQFPFRLAGTYQQGEQTGCAKIGMRFALEASDLNELFALLPPGLIPDKRHYQIAGSTSLQGEIQGEIGNGALPDVRISGNLTQGSFHEKEKNQGFDDINLELQISYQQATADSCYIDLRNVRFNGLNSHIQAESRISKFSTEPFITADIKGNIDFDRIGRELVTSKNLVLKGRANADISTAFNLKDLQAGNLHRIWADGTIKASHIEARDKEHGLDTFIAGMDMAVGYKKNKSDFIAGNDVLSATADIDSMKIEWGKRTFLNLAHLHLRSNTAVPKLSESRPPITLHLDCNTLQAKLSEESWISGEKVEFHAGMKASSNNAKQNEGAALLRVANLKYLDYFRQNTLTMSNCELITEGRPNPQKSTTATQAQRWSVKGMVNYEQAKAYSASFPLIVQSNQGRVSFQNNQLLLNHMQLRAGQSDCILSGIVTSKSEQDAGNQIEGSLQLIANNLDYDELMQTYLYGEALQQKDGAHNLHLDNALTAHTDRRPPIKVDKHPIYLPKGIRLELQMDIEHMNYQQVQLHQLRGNLLLKEQQALFNASTRTNLGKVNVDLLYDSRQPKAVKASFDLNLQDVLVAQMHQTIPTLATMFPLTKSMDGLMDCHLTAEGPLDNEMIPILSSTQAICSISGQKLKIMDNETFSEMARRFKFKNKKVNEISQLKANFVLQNSMVDVIPFSMDWDRYKAIIGGKHSIDLTYDYHITMLKSPIPIDFGINLTGKDGDLHFKLGKCKYKELFKDGGTNYNRQVEEKLRQLRSVIQQHIKL